MRNNAVLAALLTSSMMTPAERAKGRFMRAPDGHGDGGSGHAEFDEFVASGEVEVGDSNRASQDEDKPAKKPARRGPPKEAAPTDDTPKPGEEDDTPKPGDEDEPGEGDEDEPGEGEGDEDEEQPKKRKTASDRIRELNARLRQRDRLVEQLSARMEALEKGGLPAGEKGGNAADEIGDAPDPQDTAKYPLGHLDDRYIEDKLNWLAEKKAAERADAALQRQQETEQAKTFQQEQEVLLGKVDDLATRGSELYEDFQEAVVDAGLKGKYPLQQATFEAAHEADHGAQILYELSQDKKLAKEVAGKTPYQQLRWVMARDAEIAAKAKPRTKPGAGVPPTNVPRGANSRTAINPATDNLDDFEKAWNQDAKKS